MAVRAAKGTGSVKPRTGYPGVWRLRWRDATGAERTTSFRGSRAAAYEELKRRMTLDGATVAPTPDKPEAGGRTLSDALEQYATNHSAKGDSPRSVNEARRLAASDRISAVSEARLDRLTPDMLDRLYSSLTGDGLAPATVRKYHATISAALSDAVAYGWLTENPAKRCRAVPSVPVPQGEVPITAEDAGRIIAAADDKGDLDMAAAVHLALALGARRGELCALRWSDVDLDTGMATIAGNLIKDGQSWVRKTTKSGRERTVVLPSRTVAALKQLRKIRPDDVNVLRIHPDKITDRFRKLCADQAITGATFHDLRHAATTYRLNAGIDPITVTRDLGWSSTRMLDRYGHSLTESQHAAAAVMDDVLPELTA